ncbi:glycine zipper 2TM domain-containing protein [Pseudoduganella sp. RAF53_2]|jgi:outer membrane lipoprotein SlyB|uniref:glycine zipper 2TM domain-containing protein n=1 Tax=unclassified Pseudoduganella TaxID=2637179 RepID=UPI003F9617BD
MKIRNLLLPALLAVAATGAHAEPKRPVCNECGTVTNVRMIEKDGEGGATGLIAGGIAGGLLGHQVGGGTGKTLATVAGAAGGAYAGKKIEGKMNKVKEWHVTVKYETGKVGTVILGHDPNLRNGDHVRRENGNLNRI